MELFHLKNMQKKFMLLFTFMLLRVVYIYGTITGRKGTSTGYEEKILMPGVHPSVVSFRLLLLNIRNINVLLNILCVCVGGSILMHRKEIRSR